MSLSATFLLITFIQRPVVLAVSDADGITQALSPSAKSFHRLVFVLLIFFQYSLFFVPCIIVCRSHFINHYELIVTHILNTLFYSKFSSNANLIEILFCTVK